MSLTETQLISAACDVSANGRHPVAVVLHPEDYFGLFQGDTASFAVPWGLVKVMHDRYAPVGSINWLAALPVLKPSSPIQFAVGRPRDPDPP